MAMSIGARELRVRAAEVFRAVQEGETVTLTYRGRPVAEIRPIRQPRQPRPVKDEAFGMWRGRQEFKDPRKWVREGRRLRAAR